MFPLICYYYSFMLIGIIGGSGLDDPRLLTHYEEKIIPTKWGFPSSPITLGKLSGVDVAIISRHGKQHGILPSKVNYRANIQAFKDLGVTHILATTAVGSLKEDIKPGNIVFPDQFIDFTRSRPNTFCEEGVVHTPMSEPFDGGMRSRLCEICENLGYSYNKDVTIVTIEGPRFSTKAESRMFQKLGADIINMSTCPEVILANELGIPYQSIAMSTDYDCWKENEEPVNFEMVITRMKANSERVKKLIVAMVEVLATSGLKSKIRTIPNWPKEGVMFRDITTLLKDQVSFNICINDFVTRYSEIDIDVVAGIESRGFILGGALANKLGVGFVPIRKKGKLPAECEYETYQKEYGTDTIEVHRDAISYGQKVLLVDDLLATGGTSFAAARLLKKLGAEIVELAFVVDLPDLKGGEVLREHGLRYYAQVKFEGD